MFASEKQQCEAITLLLESLGMGHLWCPTGPTYKAKTYLRRSPLSSGEKILLCCAFDFWGGQGKVQLYRDILGNLDSDRTYLVLSLAIAVNSGGKAVAEWIAKQKDGQSPTVQRVMTRFNDAIAMKRSAHAELPFPHGISCPDCRAVGKCNVCGLFAGESICTNGRCQECCVKNCKHVMVG